MRVPVRSGYDVWVGSALPSANHQGEKRVEVSGTVKYGLYHFDSPVPAGATVTSSVIRVAAKGASSGARTLQATPLSGGWKERTVIWSGKPAAGTVVDSSVAVGTLADKQQIDIPNTASLQAIVNGAPNYGWQVSCSGAIDLYSFEQGDNAPVMIVYFQEAPSTPTDLRPAGGRVGVALPILRWTYAGTEDQTDYQVQADSAANWTTPAYDTGTLASSKAQHTPTWTLLSADGNATWWRVRVRSGGLWSSWSDAVLVTRDNKGTGALSSPTGGFVFDPTPPILFSLTGETLRAFEVFVTLASDRTTNLFWSQLVESAVGAYTLPEKGDNGKQLLTAGKQLSVGVRMYDTKTDRQGSPATGDEPYVDVWADFTLSETTPTAPTMVSVAQDGAKPCALITVTRATPPDSWVLTRDGEEINASQTAADTFTTGTTYVLRDWTAKPGVAHVYRVRAKVNGTGQGPVSSPATLTGGLKLEGTWIADPGSTRAVCLGGTDVGSWGHAEIGETFWPVGARKGFRITQLLGGLAGTFAGLMRERSFTTVAAMEADFWKMKETAPRSPDFRLVADYLNIPVQLYDMSLSVSEDSFSTEGYPRRRVGFGFFQTGEFEFESKV